MWRLRVVGEEGPVEDPQKPHYTDDFESDLIAAYRGTRPDGQDEILHHSKVSPSSTPAAGMERAKRKQVEAATEYVRAQSKRVSAETTMLTEQGRSVLRERSILLTFVIAALLIAAVFVMMGMFLDPRYLTGTAAMSTLAGGCGYRMQILDRAVGLGASVSSETNT
jgi:hypothetical protein